MNMTIPSSLNQYFTDSGSLSNRLKSLRHEINEYEKTAYVRGENREVAQALYKRLDSASKELQDLGNRVNTLYKTTPTDEALYLSKYLHVSEKGHIVSLETQMNKVYTTLFTAQKSCETLSKKINAYKNKLYQNNFNGLQQLQGELSGEIAKQRALDTGPTIPIDQLQRFQKYKEFIDQEIQAQTIQYIPQSPLYYPGNQPYPPQGAFAQFGPYSPLAAAPKGMYFSPAQMTVSRNLPPTPRSGLETSNVLSQEPAKKGDRITTIAGLLEWLGNNFRSEPPSKQTYDIGGILSSLADSHPKFKEHLNTARIPLTGPFIVGLTNPQSYDNLTKLSKLLTDYLTPLC